MGKMCCTAIGVGITGAIIGLHLYMCMPDRDQRRIHQGLRDIVDDLKDVADKLQ